MCITKFTCGRMLESFIMNNQIHTSKTKLFKTKAVLQTA